MKDKLRELSKVERVRLFVSASDENLKIPTCVLSWLADYANILDAEGDGGAVGDEVVDRVAKAIADAAGHGMREKCEHMAHAAISAYRLATWPETHPARSSVVSDEDVEAACRVNYESDGNSKWDKLAECWKVKHRTAMRAALEHFAKGERHER